MGFRKFCFNSTIFRKNVRSFWPVWFSWFLVCLWTLPIYTWLQMHNYTEISTLEQARQQADKLRFAVESLSPAISPWPVFFFGVVSAIAVFSYLYQSRSANMIHALPVRREALFLTNYISGLLFLLVPQFLAFVITIFVWFGNGITHLEYLLRWLGLAAGEAFLAYSLAVFAAMLTGQAAVGVICYAGLNYLYKGLVNIVSATRGMLVYGMNRRSEESWGDWLSPIPFLQENVQLAMEEKNQKFPIPEIQGMDCLLWYGLLACLLTAAALAVYRSRALETASDVVAISWLKPVFRWCGGVIAGGFCTYMVWETLFPDRFGNLFWFVLLFGSVTGMGGFFLCEMIIRKKFMVFTGRRMKESGLFLAVLVLFLVCVEKDITGLEQKMPEEDEIAGIYLEGSYQMYLEEPEEIRRCMEVHQSVIQSKKEFEQYFQKNFRKKEKPPVLKWSLTYKLKNGRSLKRSYDLPLEDCHVEDAEGATGKLFALEYNPEKYLEYYFSAEPEQITLTGEGSFLHINGKGEYRGRELSKEEEQKLYQALKEDILSGNFRIYPWEYRKRDTENYTDALSFNYRVPEGTRIFQGMEEKFYDGKYPEYVTVSLTRGCEKTINLLRELEILEENERIMTEREFQSIMEDTGLLE